MKAKYLKRQITALVLLLLAVGLAFSQSNFADDQPVEISSALEEQFFGDKSSLEVLGQLEVKGRAPKTNYQREQFGNGWGKISGCSLRETILARDLIDPKINDKCQVESGVLPDPYTGEQISFQRGVETSGQVQIDHVVALSDAWQKGAQQVDYVKRVELANDPLNLLAVSGSSNQAKGDSDAATWLPPNKPFRCQYVSRQIAVKHKYKLWVTEAEKNAMTKVLMSCTE